MTWAAGAGAFVAPVAGAVAFTGLVAAGGTTGIPLGTVFAAVTGAHVLVGAVEALLTALTVRSLLRVRPDLVRGRVSLTPPLAVPVGQAP